MDKGEIKQELFDLGADLCGIADLERFAEAPEGYHPLDVLPTCKSVIVFAKCFPAGVLACNTAVPYTVVRNTLSAEMDRMCSALMLNGKAFWRYLPGRTVSNGMNQLP